MTAPSPTTGEPAYRFALGARHAVDLVADAVILGLVPGAVILGLVPGAVVLGLVPDAVILGLVPGAVILGLVPDAVLVGLVPDAVILGLDDRKAAAAGRLLAYSNRRSADPWSLRGDSAEDQAGENADQQIVVADADPLLAGAGTAQAIVAIVADRLVALPA